MHPRVAVHEFSTGDLSFAEELELWTDLGVTHVGLVPAKVDVVGRDAVGAGCVYVVPGRAGGLPWEQLFDNFRNAIAPSVTRARELGVRLAFEPCAQIRSDISFVNQLDDAIDVAEATGLGVLVDFAACWMQRGLAQRFLDAREHIALVQVSDFAIGSLVSPDRRVPGDGDLPLPALIEQVLAAGYHGPFELEVFGPAIDDEGTAAAIARGTERLSALLDAAGA